MRRQKHSRWRHYVMIENTTKNPIILKCQDISKTYQDGEQSITVLKKLSIIIGSGEKTAIIGPSGSGKSTLLHLLGGLDACSSGSVLLNGKSWAKMSELKRCQARNHQLGFIYQFHHLLAEFSALENVMMPLLLSRNFTPKEALSLAEAKLEAVGLSHRLSHKPSQLSGGERQRVAIARAMVMKPSCILADEPTGNLDRDTANDVFELLLTLNKEANTALVIVTHDLLLAKKMDRQLHLNQGQLQ